MSSAPGTRSRPARRLWHLVGQSKEVRPDAIFALANLFATLTREGEDASQVLDLLKERLSRVSGRGADDGEDGRPRRNPLDDRRIRERVMLSILAVLIVRDPQNGQSSVSSFLGARPRSIGRWWRSCGPRCCAIGCTGKAP